LVLPDIAASVNTLARNFSGAVSPRRPDCAVSGESEHDRRMMAIGLLFVRMVCDCFKSRQQLEVLRHQLNGLQQRALRRPHLRWARRGEVHRRLSFPKIISARSDDAIRTELVWQ
jgi:hypothetical protein